MKTLSLATLAIFTASLSNSAFAFMDVKCASEDGQTKVETRISADATEGEAVVIYEGEKKSYLSYLNFLMQERDPKTQGETVILNDTGSYYEFITSKTGITLDLFFIKGWDYQAGKILKGDKAITLENMNCDFSGYGRR